MKKYIRSAVDHPSSIQKKQIRYVSYTLGFVINILDYCVNIVN